MSASTFHFPTKAGLLVMSTSWIRRCARCAKAWTCPHDEARPRLAEILGRIQLYPPDRIADLVRKIVAYEIHPDPDSRTDMVLFLGGGPSAHLSSIRDLEATPELVRRLALNGHVSALEHAIEHGWPLPESPCDPGTPGRGWAMSEITTPDLHAVVRCAFRVTARLEVVSDDWVRLMVYLMSEVPEIELEVLRLVATRREGRWPAHLLADLATHLPDFDRPAGASSPTPYFAWPTRKPVVKTLAMHLGCPGPDPLEIAERMTTAAHARAAIRVMDFTVLDWMAGFFGTDAVIHELFTFACLRAMDEASLWYLCKWGTFTDAVMERFLHEQSPPTSASDRDTRRMYVGVLLRALNSGGVSGKHSATLASAVRALSS